MLSSFRLRRAIGWSVRGATAVSGGCLGLGLVLLLPAAGELRAYLANASLTAVIILSLLPAAHLLWASALFRAEYEGLAWSRGADRHLLLLFLLAVSVPLIIGAQHASVRQFVTVGFVVDLLRASALLLFLALFVPGQLGEDRWWSRLGGTLKFGQYVLWAHWSGVRPPLPREYFVSRLRSDDRRRRYEAREGVSLFQQSFYGPELEAASIAPALARALLDEARLSRPLTVLDIGCGEGRYTSRLLAECIRLGARFGHVTAVDPEDWSFEYTQAIARVAPDASVRFENLRFGSGVVAGQYDLVVASHSLYSLLDGSGDSGIVEVLSNVSRSLKPSGALVIQMSSESSPLYAVRQRVSLDWPDVDQVFSVAEDVGRVLPEGCELRESVETFCAVRLDELTGASESEGFAAFRSWCSFFFRLPLRKGSHSELEDIRSHLQVASVGVSAMPRDELSRIRAAYPGAITVDARFVRHITVGYVFVKSMDGKLPRHVDRGD